MPDTAVGQALTDNTGVSSLTVPKLVKDLIADILLSGAAALAAVQIVNLDQAAQQPTVVSFALGGAVIRAVYRAALKWATT